VTSLVWFRRDLRLVDNPALYAAAKRGGPVVAIFIYAPEEESPWEPGCTSCWWLYQSLAALDAELDALGSRLIIRRGPSLKALRTVISETGADALFWNRGYERAVIERDQMIKTP
jgi:deoxyribodipyrimidine photo-lyase